MEVKNFKRAFSNIEKMKNDINNLNRAINLEYEKLKKIHDKFESNSVCSIVDFNQTVDLEKNYFKNNGNIKYIKTLINSISKENEDELKNMWISEKYCKTWGLREGIREFLQNQYDGIITKIQNKKNLEVQKIGKEYLIDGRKKHLDYDFLKKGESKIFGKIRFDNDKNILSISNEGELILADFLLGGTKDEQKNSDLIGVFGEGMKLAILALCRLNKPVTISSSNKIYNFELKEDYNFIKDSKPQKCLHCKIENNFEEDLKDKVKVLIHNISKNEWSNEIDNFLWLLGEDIEIYTSVDSYNDEIGQVIYDDYMRNKIYVKGIFVQEINKNKDDEVKQFNKEILGFNANLKVDRDRNCVQSNYDLQRLMSKIVSGIFNKNTDYLEDSQKNGGHHFIRTEYGFEKTDKNIIETNKKSQLYSLPKNLVNCLSNSSLDLFNEYTLSSNLNKKSLEIIWNEVNTNPENKGKQPTNNAKAIINFIEEKKLPKEFYPYYTVSYGLMRVLEKSHLYKDINKKFAEYVDESVNVEPNDDYKASLNYIYSKITEYIPNFDGSKVKFKDFSSDIDKDFSFKNNKDIYFSAKKLRDKLDEKWKFWIFIKILNISDIKIEDSYSLVNEVFKKDSKNLN